MQGRRTVEIDGRDVCAELSCVLMSFDMQPPNPKTSYLEVPGRSGSYDLSEALAGYPLYSDRTMTMEFCVLPTDVRVGEAALTAAMGRFHGRQVEVRLSWDAEYTYKGRATVSKLVRYPVASAFEVSVRCEPYKLKRRMAVPVGSAGGAWVEFESGDKPVVPTWTTTVGDTSILFEGKEHWIRFPSSQRFPDIVFRKGANRAFVFNEGTGGVKTEIGDFSDETLGDHADDAIADLMWSARPTGSGVVCEYDWSDL